MGKQERDLLKQWIATSRDNIEKRFWPTVILGAVIGVIVDPITNTPVFQVIYKAIVTLLESVWFSLQLQVNTQAPTPNIWLFLGILVVVTIVVWFVYTLSVLLRAMVVRGLILEACELAEYYYQQGKPVQTEPTSAIPKTKTPIEQLIGLFFR